MAAAARSHGVTAYLTAMTGYGQPEDQHRAQAAGFDRHLTKPVTGDRLRETLDEVARGPARDTAATDSSRTG